MASLTIDGGALVGLGTLGGVESRRGIQVEGDRISGIVPSGAAETRRGRLLDATDALVMPGLVNAHTHSPENLARGAVDRVVFEDWHGMIWPALDHLAPDQIRIAILLGCAEMLRSGTTSVIDHFRQLPMTLEAVGAAHSAYREAGIRCGLAVMARDRQVPSWVISPGPDPGAFFREAINEFHEEGALVQIMLGPSAPHRCTDALLEELAELSADQQLYVQTHVDETHAQRQEAIQLCGTTALRHLARLGLLHERTSVAHCVWIDDSERILLADHGATVVHNPAANLRLASGIAPVSEMLEAGVRVALGSDGAASNDSQNMFEAMKLAILLSGARGAESLRPSALDVWAMTTGDIAGRFGMPGTGRLETGAKADMIVIEHGDACLLPTNDIHRQLVYGGAGRRIRHVVIDGQVVVEDGAIKTFDEIEVYRKAAEMKLYDSGRDTSARRT